MSGIIQNEREAEQIQPRFELDRREDEPSGNWLQRVLYQPLEGFNVQSVKEKLAEVEEQRERSKAELEQEFNAICLELEAWASARPAAEHRAAFDGIEFKVRAVHEESEKQASLSYTERLRQHLLRFAEMVSGALSLLSSASQIFGPDAEGNAITAADSVSQLPANGSSPPPPPRVLVPNSEVGGE